MNKVGKDLKEAIDKTKVLELQLPEVSMLFTFSLKFVVVEQEFHWADKAKKSLK